MRIILSILLLSVCYPNTFSKTFGGSGYENGKSVKQTTDGGYIVSGSTASFGNGKHDYWLIKTDPTGNEEWNNTFGTTGEDYGWSVQQTSDGGYIMVGQSESIEYDNNDIYLVKTDFNGDEVWTRRFGEIDDAGAGSIQLTNDGGYIIAGAIVEIGSDNIDGYIIKTDPNGNEDWNKTFGGSGSETIWSIEQTVDGGYILGGTVDESIWITKIDADGNEDWSNIISENEILLCFSIKQTIDGGYILTGSIGPISYHDLLVLKVDSMGNEVWRQIFEKNEYSLGSSIQVLNNGGYIITGRVGQYGQNESNADAILLKIDENGNEEWFKNFDGGSFDYGEFVELTLDGGYIITGSTMSFGNGYYDVWLLKTDENGDIEGCNDQTACNYDFVPGATKDICEYPGSTNYPGCDCSGNVNDECGVCDSDNGNDNACFTYPETFIGNWNYTINLYNNSECTGSPTYIFEQGITSFNADSSITVSGTTVQFDCPEGFTGSNYTLCQPYLCENDVNCEGYFPSDVETTYTCNEDEYCVAADAYTGLWAINDTLLCLSFPSGDHSHGYDCWEYNYSTVELSVNIIIDSSSVAGEEYCQQVSLVKDEIPGCTDSNACNYNPAANVNDESCIYVEANYDCNGNCTAEVDCAGECGGSSIEDVCGVCNLDSSNDNACFTYPAEFIGKWEGMYSEYSTSDCSGVPDESGEDFFFTFQNNGNLKFEHPDRINGEYSCSDYPDCVVESEGLYGICHESGDCMFQVIEDGIWGINENKLCFKMGSEDDGGQSKDLTCGDFNFTDEENYLTITTTGDSDSGDCIVINLSRLKYTISIDSSTEIFDATSFVLNWRQGESIFETNIIEVVRDTIFQVGYQEPGSEPVDTTTIVTPLFPTLGSKWSGMFSGPAHFEVQELTHIIVPADTALAYIYQIHNLSLEEYRGSMTFATDLGMLSMMQIFGSDTFSIVLESKTIVGGNGVFPLAVGNEWVYVDGNYDDMQIQGCTKEEACNYVEYADIDDDSCEYAEENYDCDGNCIVEIDCAEVCGGTAELDVCEVCGGNGPAEGIDCYGQPLSLFNGLIPEDFSIHSIYPNPFNPVTNIIYGLPEHVNVQIVVYDLTGKKVATLINQFQTPGYHSINWNADNHPSGVYFVKIVAGDYINIQKLMLMK